MSEPLGITLADFMADFGEAAAAAVVEQFPPRYASGVAARYAGPIRQLRRKPIGAQRHAISALAESLTANSLSLLVGEMGTGKSLIAASAVWAAGYRRALTISPSHLVRKWKREIESTIPGAHGIILRDLEDVAQFATLCHTLPATTPLYGIVSKETAKLGAAWRPVYRERDVPYHDEQSGATGRVRAAACPSCGVTVVDKDGVPLALHQFDRKRRFCQSCRGALWSVGDPARAKGFTAGVSPRERFALWAERTDAAVIARGWRTYAELRGVRTRRWRWHRDGEVTPFPSATHQGGLRWPLAAAIRRVLTGRIDVFIADEAHQFKAKGSAQGKAYADLAATATRTLAATGTLLGGYSSTIFYLLQRADPVVRAEFGFHESDRWVTTYGVWEVLHKKAKRDAEEVLEDGSRSERKEYTSSVYRERPGIHPLVLLRILPNTVFLKLADVAADLPPYREFPVLVAMAPEQAAMYKDLEEQLVAALMACLQAGSKRLLGAYLQALLAWPDNCSAPETVNDGAGDGPVAHVDGLSAEAIYPKEAELLRIVNRAKGRGRRSLVYCTHTGARDITPRLKSLLERAGHRVAVLKADSVAAERREAWVEARVKEGIDVLITNPRCVETGLDLLDFSTIAWVEVDYSSYVMRQASRRSWRIGQTEDVEVHFLCYAETLQATALALMKAKIRASLLLEGELPEGGLAGEGTDEDLFLQMARKLAQGHQGGALDEIFTDGHEAELQADRFLGAAYLDDGEDPVDVPDDTNGLLALPLLALAGRDAADRRPLLVAGVPAASPRGTSQAGTASPGPPVARSGLAAGGQLALFDAAQSVAADPVRAIEPAGGDTAATGGRARIVSWEELAAQALLEKRTRIGRAKGGQTRQLPLA